MDDKVDIASRAAWRLYKGEIPDGYDVLHQCDVPSCVNPDHLFLGTVSDNMRDAVKKGRHVAVWRDIQKCKRGHPFTEDNTRHYKGGRWCRTCMREHARNARAIDRALKGGPR